jgi:hypothetical protein
MSAPRQSGQVHLLQRRGDLGEDVDSPRCAERPIAFHGGVALLHETPLSGPTSRSGAAGGPGSSSESDNTHQIEQAEREAGLRRQL